MTKYQKIFKEIVDTKGYKTIGEDIQYKIIVNHEAKEVILQWQESEDWKDWLHNFLFMPARVNLAGHKVWTTLGYSRAYTSTRNIPIYEFILKCDEFDDYKKIIRGYSFGSAMTKIAVRHFYYITKQKVDIELTYGDVKCWLNPFTSLLSKLWCADRKEFTYINDFVTWCVPFYFRTAKKKVGDKFSFKKLFSTTYNHTHYEEYDYSKYE